jgi:hypothetical protein
MNSDWQPRIAPQIWGEAAGLFDDGSFIQVWRHGLSCTLPETMVVVTAPRRSQRSCARAGCRVKGHRMVIWRSVAAPGPMMPKSAREEAFGKAALVDRYLDRPADMRRVAVPDCAGDRLPSTPHGVGSRCPRAHPGATSPPRLLRRCSYLARLVVTQVRSAAI